MTAKTCFQISPDDNVAVVLEDAEAGETLNIVGGSGETITLREAIKYGHKVAIRSIEQGSGVVKYGIRIATATETITAGQNVHLHNCVSDYDERSGNFDPKTGAAIDTQYK